MDKGLHEIYEFAPIGIEQVALKDGRLLAVNSKLCAILGRPRAALLRTTFARLTHPEDLERERVLLRQLISGEIPSYVLEKRYRHRSGRWVWVRVSSAKAGGGIPSRVSVVEDITDRRAALEDQSRMAAIVEDSDDAIISKDLGSRVVTWNLGAERLFGYTAAEMIGRSITALIPSSRRGEERSLLDRIRRGEKVQHYETVRLHKDGHRIDVSLSLSPLRASNGGVAGASVIVRDISERNRQHRTLLESEARTMAIVSTAVDAIITIDDRGTIDWANPSSERLFGYPAAELVGQNVKLLMPAPCRSEHDGYLRSYVRTGVAKIIGIGREVTGRRKDGSTFPMSLAVSEMRLGSRRMFTGIVHDLTGRRQLEREVLEASTGEQRRIGQDLHDGLCQELVSLILGAEITARKLQTKGLLGEAAQVDKLGEALQAVTKQARQLAHGLNPVDVEGGGLTGALEQLASRVSESTGIRCRFESDDARCTEHETVATNLYRIAQEAVGNAIKHAKASRIDLSLTYKDRCLTLRIRDNGRGLPGARPLSAGGLATAPSLPPHSNTPLRNGIGLQTMNYRARLIGGTFDIRPAPGGGGTVVTCSVRYDDGHTRASPLTPSAVDTSAVRSAKPSTFPTRRGKIPARRQQSGNPPRLNPELPSGRRDDRRGGS